MKPQLRRYLVLPSLQNQIFILQHPEQRHLIFTSFTVHERQPENLDDVTSCSAPQLCIQNTPNTFEEQTPFSNPYRKVT